MDTQLVDLVVRNSHDPSALLTALERNEDVILRNGEDVIDRALSALSPANNAVGFIFLLGCKAELKARNFAPFVQHLVAVLQQASTSAFAYLGRRMAMILRVYAERYFEKKMAHSVVGMLTFATQRMAPDASYLTPAHPLALQACLLAKNYKAALHVLGDQPIVFVDGAGANVRDYMLYCYYGGMVHCGLKQWAAAIKLFTLCVTTPAMALSMIAVEAYKKYVLASLILSGTVETAPRNVTASVLRGVKIATAPYLELAHAYATRDIAAVTKVVNAHQNTFTKDANFGLVMQVCDGLPLQNVLRLTKTFVTVSLDDIAQRLKLQDSATALRHVLTMIERGDVRATIDRRAGMVRFEESAEKNDDMSAVQSLHGRLSEIIRVRKMLDGVDNELLMTTAYVSRLVTQDKDSSQPGVGRMGAF